MGDCSLHLFAGATIRGPDGALTGAPVQRHRLALLALLAIAYPRAVARDRVLALLWPERDGHHARALLNLAVHVLRRALGPDALRASGDALLLDVDVVPTDVTTLERAWDAGDAETAVAAYAGPFLDGFHLPDASAFHQWADAERERLASLQARALAAAARHREARGDREGAIDAWQRLGAHDPYGGATALRVMKALGSLGARSAALEHARRHERLLREEFDASPDPGVVALGERLRAPRPAPVAVPSGAARELGDLEQAEALCTRGRFFWTQRTPEQLRRAVAHFERALEVAPGYAPAYAGLADAWAVLGFYAFLAPRASFGRARPAARQALAQDPSTADAFASMAYVRLYHDWRWDVAERGFRRALRMDSRNPKANQWLGNLLVVQGRHDEAVARMRRVRALQPLTPVANAVPGWACFHAGRLDEAADHLLEAIELDPHFAIGRLWMGQVELARGRYAEAIASLERASALLEGGTIADAALAHAHATAGCADAAEERLTRLRAVRHAGSYVPAYDLARVELALGRPEAALRELRTALAERGHSLTFLLVDPQMAALREHPETRAIARTIGLTR